MLRSHRASPSFKVNLFERLVGVGWKVFGAALRFRLIGELVSPGSTKRGVVIPELSTVVALVQESAGVGGVDDFLAMLAAAAIKARSSSRALYRLLIFAASRSQYFRAWASSSW